MTSCGSAQKLTSKLAYAAIGWTSALFIALRLGSVYALISTAAATVVSAAFLWRKTRYSRFAMLISAAGLAGALFFSVYDAQVVKKQQALDGRYMTVSGTVYECDRIGGDMLRLTVKGRCSDSGIIKVKAYCRDTDIRCGDRVRLSFTAVLPENNARFSEEDYLNSQGIFIQSDGLASAVPTGSVNRPLRALKLLREKTISAILAKCPGKAGAFIVSVLCADRTRLDASVKSSIYRSGLGHMFAVSGTHVVMLTAFIIMLIEPVITSKKKRSALMLLILTGFAVFAGGTASVVRACLMSGLGFSAAFFNRRSASANSLGAAAILITMNCPFALTSVSFLLSFASAFSFGVLSPMLCRERTESATAKTLIAYICVFITTFPLAAYFFSKLPIITVFTNLLLIPLCSLCLCSAFVFMLSGGLLTPAVYLSELTAALVIRICSAVTRSSSAYAGTYYKDSLVFIGIAAIAVTLFLALKRERKRADIVFFIMSCITVCTAVSMLISYVPSDMLMIYPDGGSYTAMLYTDGRAMIFDIGDRGRFRYNAARDAESLNAEDIRLFLSGNTYSTLLRYSAELTDLNEAYARSALGSIKAMPDRLTIGKALVSLPDDYTVRLGSHVIRLERNAVIVDGAVYLPEGFEGISVFRLK